MNQTTLTQSTLKARIDYDPNTGVFKWRVRRGPVKAGSVAGSTDTHGYRQIKFDAKSHLAHRLAWLYIHGVWPMGQLDHRNGVKDDNRIDNLREATQSQNLANRTILASNTSGYKGVYWDKTYNKWKAQIGHHRKVKNLGRFTTPEEAHAAYCAVAAVEFGDFAHL